MTIQPVIHYFLHFIFPLFIALVFYRQQWQRAYLLLLLTMLVDIDHLLALPVFSPCRCSIGFHPLHSYIAIGIYALGLLPRSTRLIAIGLLLHMATDLLDCYLGTIYCR